MYSHDIDTFNDMVSPTEVIPYDEVEPVSGCVVFWRNGRVHQCLEVASSMTRRDAADG